MLLILQNLHPLHFLIGLPLLIYLAVLVFHLLRSVRHLDHDLLQVLHLDPSDLRHRVAVVLLLFLVVQSTAVEHGVPDALYIYL